MERNIIIGMTMAYDTMSPMILSRLTRLILRAEETMSRFMTLTPARIPFKKGYQCLSFSNLRIFFRLASKNIWLHWSENQLTDRETEQDSRGELEQVVCISGRGVSAKYYLRPVLFFHEASKTNQFSEVNHILATG